MTEESITQRQLLAEVAEERRQKRAQLVERVRQLHAKGVGTIAIGLRLGLGRYGASRVLRQLGLESNPEEP